MTKDEYIRKLKVKPLFPRDVKVGDVVWAMDLDGDISLYFVIRRWFGKRFVNMRKFTSCPVIIKTNLHVLPPRKLFSCVQFDSYLDKTGFST